MRSARAARPIRPSRDGFLGTGGAAPAAFPAASERAPLRRSFDVTDLSNPRSFESPNGFARGSRTFRRSLASTRLLVA